MVCALITIFYGPEIAHAGRQMLHEHPSVLLGIVGVAVVWLLVYILRKMFARRGGTRLPIEETTEMDESAETDDSTLIT
jgi:hypothetical protein